MGKSEGSERKRVGERGRDRERDWNATHERMCANTISRKVFADFHHITPSVRDIVYAFANALAFFICTYHSHGLLMSHKNDGFIDRKEEIK